MKLVKEAEKLVNKDRQAEYGSAHDNYGTAELLTETIEIVHSRTKDKPMSASKRGLWFMLFTKIARVVCGKPKRDSFVDMIGYIILIAREYGVKE